MGKCVKLVLVYNHAFWLTRSAHDNAISHSKLLDYFGHNIFSSSAGGLPALVILITGDAAIRYSALDEATRRSAIFKQLTDMYTSVGDEKNDDDYDVAALPVRYIEKDWSVGEEGRWSGGCFAGLLGVGGLVRCGGSVRVPSHGGRCHWAGTETAHEWCGYMEGAVRAGERAAKECLLHYQFELN